MFSTSLTIIALFFLADDPSPVTPGNEIPIPALPYVTDQPLVWRWVHAGNPVGESRVQISSNSEGNRQDWVISARLSWNRAGRAIDQSQTTTFSGDARSPISYRRQLMVEAVAGGISDLIVAAEIQKNQVRVVVREPRSGGQVDRMLDFPDGTVLLGNQAFEHWLLIGDQLARTDRRTFSALIPSEYRTTTLKISKERSEQVNGKPFTRWHVVSPDFEARIWTGPKGEVERYRQGELEIQRVHSKPQPKAEPQKQPQDSDKEDSSEQEQEKKEKEKEKEKDSPKDPKSPPQD